MIIDIEEEDEESHYYSSPPSFKFHWDVFLSFRGEDTRSNFTASLYKELKENGIRTFLDDEGLERGEEIHKSLLNAISDSATSILVISENYADSRWCLEELSKILECRRFLIPVFYGVHPSDVRELSGRFGLGFQTLQQRFGTESKMVTRWKNSLEKVGGVSGLYSKEFRDETQLIQLLVKKILARLSNTPLGVAKYPVGISSRVEEVLKMLDLISDNDSVQIIGIHGTGGIGKTTLAKAVYNKIGPQFERRIFISDIRESSRKNNGLISLQNKLINNLFPNTSSTALKIDNGISMIRERILNKRVLFVLDDVDNVSQLDALVGNRDMYLKGSRIIITTRDRNLLTGNLVTHIYDMKELDAAESLQLFSYHAFGRDQPKEAFKRLSEQVVSIAGGVSLALEVLGTFFYGKEKINEWADGLENLKHVHPGNLHEVLKFSFEALDVQEKCIFLDTACFFSRMKMNREDMVDIFKGCGLNSEMSITNLTTRSFIKFVQNNIVWMHDQFRDMGRQIVRDESGGILCMQSRLWVHDEVMEILKYEKGTRRIQGIILNVENCSTRRNVKEKDVYLCTKQFAPMGSLRLLHINHIGLKGKFKFIPPELKWLQWKECSLKYLPSDFYLPELAVLDFTGSEIKKLWSQKHGAIYKVPEKLKVLNLSGCSNLTESPDFSGHRHLEKLVLERCTSLVTINESIGDQKTLLLMNLKDCSSLVKFPSDISGLRNLKNLILSGCSKLKALPQDLKSMRSLINLLADGTAIEELPDTIGYLKKLERLSLNGCMSLRHLPKNIGGLASLTELSLNGSSLEDIPDSIGCLEKLEILSLKMCEAISTLPDSIGNLKLLLELFLDGTAIKTLPDSIGGLSSLNRLSLRSCRFLNQFPASIKKLAFLVHLQLENTLIENLPNEIGNWKIGQDI